MTYAECVKSVSPTRGFALHEGDAPAALINTPLKRGVGPGREEKPFQRFFTSCRNR